ncbi:MAG: LacI family DNA-binding transcriptional regulator [Gemmatimonas sp.]|nr:LacI family DNA-binding transcriptional regulator [Gemmatimonas sp.]MCA2986446.1 LacI family DNA-binding transcriptional regulator [Gemmatimonas sp.]
MTRDPPRSNERTVTMVDVARHAKVSVATVSRVLNTPERGDVPRSVERVS